jgi:peptidoglycan hydrolase-like protein with peptidoglycan-binding domain
MATTGIARIDALWLDPAEPAFTRDNEDVEGTGAVQDLLIGHGARLPGILETNHGKYGPKTEAAVRAFQDEHGLPLTGSVDQATLKALALQPAMGPVAANAYVTLALDLAWTGFTRLVGLTAQFEAAGKFTARNRNTDRAGLSFGIIQWAQKPGRLNGLGL